ncbi:Esterase/lipase superfamily enzyme [Cohaesibacter sp. ES.047]|uniref:alpha/beta hydrolase n=1 Tax=Cohaesibacter sp. ES.047 TaxID=1798205 RepID=UPI000BB87E00|nr:alpha/beta hydrolase [Cohaesibacter sp. ES.047]SNY91933.1 Esterase/lipase superfamily enzyme [Cohaesibacter sp. ES.047]
MTEVTVVSTQRNRRKREPQIHNAALLGMVRPVMAAMMLGALLAGCAAPTGIRFAQTPTISLETESIVVATTRVPKGHADFTGERAGKLQYASYQVSIPPGHKIGEIEWPRSKPDPKKYFAVASTKPLTGSSMFSAQINADLAAGSSPQARGKREATLFAHGYNTDFSEALYRAAQIKHDFDMTAPMALFSWPSAGSPGLYIYDRDSVKASRDQLVSVIKALAASKVDHITLMAHSLGTELLMESLRQVALANNGRLPSKIQSVVLISPDIDMDVFNSQLATIRTLPKNFVILVSARDRALQLSSLLAGDTGRVGNSLDETRIKREGITVVDVTGFDGGDSMNHMTAVTAPSLVALLKGVAMSGKKTAVFENSNDANLPGTLINTATLPLDLVVKTTRTIFDQ